MSYAKTVVSSVGNVDHASEMGSKLPPSSTTPPKPAPSSSTSSAPGWNAYPLQTQLHALQLPGAPDRVLRFLYHAYRAVRAVETLRDRITPHLYITELRAIAAVDLS